MPIHLKLLFASLFWGATPTIGRVLAHYEAPFAVVFGRFFVAMLFLLLFMWSAKQFAPVARRMWWRLLVLGVTGIFLHNGLMYKGLEYTTATTTSIILALIATQVVILDLIFYRKLPDRLALLGVAVAFLGTLFVITDGRIETLFSVGFGFGEMLIFLSALVWAVYSIVGRDVLEEYSPLLVTTYATVIGVICLAPFLFARPEVTFAIYTDGIAVACIFLLGFIGSALGFLWYYQAVVEMGTVGAAIYINLVPVFGVLTAALVLGETLNSAIVGGGLMVFTGVLLVNRPMSADGEKATT